MSVAVALFTADLRVHDNPVLRGALDAADQVVPLFVLDGGVHAGGFLTPNRAAFLAGCLTERGGRLVPRGGDLVGEVCRVADETVAGEVHIAGDVSGCARWCEERLNSALSRARRVLCVHEAVIAAVPPGAVTPAERLGHPRTHCGSARRSRPVPPGP